MFIKLTPKAQVPVLCNKTEVITESSDICLYLEQHFKLKKFSYNDNDKQKAMLDWMKIIDATIHSACSTLTWSVAIRPEMLKKCDEELAKHFNAIPCIKRRKKQYKALKLGLSLPELTIAIKEHEKLIAKMEQQLSKTQYLVDNKLSLADICVLPYITRLEMLSFEQLLDNHSGVSSWLNKMKEDAAYQKTYQELYPGGFINRWNNYGQQAASILAKN